GRPAITDGPHQTGPFRAVGLFSCRSRTVNSYAAIMRATSNVSFPFTGQDGTSSNGQDLI
ncbi:unnamed protein product, partial [Musa hybrid cultivar]